jgi:DNA/RNA endonuclease YhcR with UshA esterase domain
MRKSILTQLFGPVLRPNFTGVLCLTGIAIGMATRGAEASPPSESAKSANVIAASDKAAIQSAMVHEVKVVGTVAKLQRKGAILVIDFKGAEHTGLSAVVLERNREAVEKVHGEGLKSIDGKRVQVTGKLVEYRDKPQIVVAKPDQISLATEPKLSSDGPTQKAIDEPKVIDVTDKTAIEAALPHEVTVAGTVSEIKETGGTVVVNFEEAKDSNFCAVVLKRNREALEEAYGKGLKSIEGKKIEVTGEVAEYRDKPEIVISAAKQIVSPNK